MNIEIIIVFATLLIALVLFASDWIRYDVVALMALLAVSVTGIITPEEAFRGFGEPAVIVVAAVLVVSRALANAGIADLLASLMVQAKRGMSFQLGIVNSIIASLSGFMSNTGALALFLPIVIKIARERDESTSSFLMPLASSALLGGLITLIGTPPNLIIASFRGNMQGQQSFAIFDYAPVGLAIAIAGLLYVCLIGWRFLPERTARSDKDSLFKINEYITEMQVQDDSELTGKSLEYLETELDVETVVVGLLRDDERITAPSGFETIQAGDYLLLQTHPRHLDDLREAGLDVALRGETEEAKEQQNRENIESGEIELVEAIIAANSRLEGEAVKNIDIRWQHGINLLAVARQNERIDRPLDDIKLRGGDILLLQGTTGAIEEALPRLGCLPLSEQQIDQTDQRDLVIAAVIFFITLGIVATGALPVEIAFVSAAVGMILLNLISLDEAYDAIHWPILILIGAMLPLGDALERSGGAELIADTLLSVSGFLPAVGTPGVLLVSTMILSNFVHNAATAALLAPVAVSIASALSASADPFLMAVAVGASCTFLTPIGHQANTIVMEAGGYKFNDYWRLGLPLSLIVVAIATPLIPIVWPLFG
jgi:di/tricarboxylate transporter